VLVTVNLNATKYVLQNVKNIKHDKMIVFFQALNAPKPVFVRDSALHPAGRANDSPPHTIAPSMSSASRTIGAHGASIFSLRPPSNTIYAYAYGAV